MSRSPYRIQKVGILGSGVMGSQIAAHCVNAGLHVVLLDLKSDDPAHPDKKVKDSLKTILKLKPAPFALPEYVNRITVGNFDDDMHLVSDVDWICEVIVERMDIKQNLMSTIDAIRKPSAIVSSNTSGLPISGISVHVSDEMKAHFIGTHFFNPPRYMKLLEVISTPATHPEVSAFMSTFCEQVLGKGVVVAKDTPNFIANRIGVFSMASIMRSFFDGRYRAETIDMLTGVLTGYSKAATFRTGDMAGLDIIAHVAGNLLPEIPEDERKEVFELPHPFMEMVKSGKIGNKSGQGFYKKAHTKEGKAFLVINAETLEYEPQQKTEDPVLEEARAIKDTAERLRFLAFSDTEIGRFVWEIQKELLLYSAHRIPEITDSPLSLDRAMKWGFNWELGPFERWDALGITNVVERLEKEGEPIPALIQEMKAAGCDQFYVGSKVYDPTTKQLIGRSPAATGEIKSAPLSERKHPVVLQNPSATIHDLGDGVALFEFTTPYATLGFELVQTLEHWLDTAHEHFDALVISHDGDNFAYGANLKEALMALQAGDYKRIEEAVTGFQRTALKLRYSKVPTVSAPFGLTFGGGCEFMMYTDHVVASHELYAGLVEIGVGLIPAGGGTTELLKRTMKNLQGDADPLAYVREVFKTIGMASVSESAHHARALGFLLETDSVIMNRNLLIKQAKEEALQLVQAGYTPPTRASIRVLGKTALSAMKLMLYVMSESNFITPYDKVVAGRVAYVIAGGDLSEPQEVPESYLLNLEREAILECLRDPGTHARMEHMLKTGKPLRN